MKNISFFSSKKQSAVIYYLLFILYFIIIIIIIIIFYYFFFGWEFIKLNSPVEKFLGKLLGRRIRWKWGLVMEQDFHQNFRVNFTWLFGFFSLAS